MMRRRVVSSKKRRTKKSGTRKTKEVSLSQLLSSAETAMSSLDVEGAMQNYSRAADLLRQGKGGIEIATRESGLLHILEKLGECKVSMGDQEGAKKDFEEALSLLDKTSEDTSTISYHETKSNLHFYVGQLCMEHEALDAYKKGVQSLESCLELMQNGDADEMEEDAGESSKKATNEVHRKLSGAYCTISELYLTDLCYDDDAESNCEKFLEKALEIKDLDGEPMVDALQTMASLRLSQKERQLEAIPIILRVYGKMKVGSEALAALVGLGESEDDDGMKGNDDTQDQARELKEVDAANNLPEFEFRCQTAKLLLECADLLKKQSSGSSQETQEDTCVSAAISILGSLLAQNDEVVEIWYLTGCAFVAKRPSLVDPARYYLERAMEMLMDVKKALDQEAQFADDEFAAEIQEQLEENQVQIEDVRAKLEEIANPEEDIPMED